jgi:serine protease DegQ
MGRKFVSISLFAIPALVAATSAAQPVPVASSSGQRPTIAPLLNDVTASVVNVAVTSTAATQRNPLLNDPLFRRFFELPEEQPDRVPQQSVGSGVIVDAEEGYILTNHHVVADADDIVVTLTDRRTLAAELIGSDSGTDIAVLKVAAENLHAVPLADSDTLAVGDFVVAIGNPFGLGQTVTSGIVSALGRGLNVEAYQSFIQTDASINPGNSGGALIDFEGELIGINTAILAPAGGNVGIGFAVPTNMAVAAMRQIVEYGEVRRGRLGVYIQTVTPDLTEALGLGTDEGALITQLEPGSAAEAAGLEVGDVIVEFNGKPVTGAPDLRNDVGLAVVGSRIALGVVRGGQRLDVEAQVEASAATQAAAPEAEGATATIDALAGAEFGNLAPGDPRYGNTEGVLVARVENGSVAARQGLRAGDVVTAVNRTRVRSVAELSSALEQAGETIALEILRGEGRIFLVLR